ncbi:MAG TPA: SHOCT domain-containing protein [Nitrospiria bacterium]|nr:SHOCT domain-containing protein [Nitrospiria bacterium]
MIRYAMVLFVLLLTVSCASGPPLRRVVHQESQLLVVLDRGEIHASPSVERAYDHPASIPPQILQVVLDSVLVQQNQGLLMSLIFGKKEKKSLLDPETSGALASELSKALSEAGPEERVDFYQTLPRDSVTVYVTSGLLFVKGERLYLHVDHYKAPLPKEDPPTEVDQERTSNPAEKKELEFELLEGPHQVHRKYRNWIGFTESDSRWLLIDYSALGSASSKEPSSVEQSESSVPPPSPPLPSSPSPSSPPALDGSLEEKLRTLKRLREEGLISEQEYIEKKRALLKDF